MIVSSDGSPTVWSATRTGMVRDSWLDDANAPLAATSGYGRSDAACRGGRRDGGGGGGAAIVEFGRRMREAPAAAGRESGEEVGAGTDFDLG
jgi:hypothetical protein